MGLVDKLTELDQYIWTQHEKVTHYCNKEFGWDKYDLARKANTSQTAFLSGAAIYLTLMGIEGKDMATVAVSAVWSLLGVGLHYHDNDSIKRREKDESKTLERTGAISKPEFNALRPAWFLFGSAILGQYIYTSVTQQNSPPVNTSLSLEEYHSLSSLVGVSLLGFHIFATAKEYFLDQIITPPKKKKSVLKTLYEKVKGKVPAVPQLDSVKPTGYQSIDEVVGE